MQDFRHLDYTTTPETLRDLLDQGFKNITVIINGEYYDLRPDYEKRTRLVVDSKTGFGTCTNNNGIKFTVLRGEGLWNLSKDDPNERFSGFWVKENVARISTLQKFADEHGYDIDIELV
jgi:hypothetical protein